MNRRALIYLLIQQLVFFPVGGWASQRSHLVTESGYLSPEQLHIDGNIYRVSNPLMGTYDIDEFSRLMESDPETWRSLHNHYRYGVVGTRGFAAGTGLALLLMATSFGRSNPVVPLGLFVAGFIYGMNSRHMARHNLHEAVNRLNGTKTD
ncbi:MAG: hypothetical protein ABL958_16535 [Bdellovibrionia bacterium]